MAKLKLDHCVIHVSDWTRSNAFYRDVMGAEVVPRGNGWVYRFGELVRRVTGKKQGVQVPHGEGVAIHIDPESCARFWSRGQPRSVDRGAHRPG